MGHDAHIGMFRIQQKMANVQPNLDDAMEVLYTFPTEAMEILFPMHLKNIKDVANDAIMIVEGILEKYQSSILFQDELVIALTKKMAQNEGKTIETHRQKRIL